MQAAFYERTGPASEVLHIDEMPTPLPGYGEVRVKVAWSGSESLGCQITRGHTEQEPVLSTHHPAQ